MTLPSGEGPYLGAQHGVLRQGEDGGCRGGCDHLCRLLGRVQTRLHGQKRAQLVSLGGWGCSCPCPAPPDAHPGLFCPLEASWWSRACRGLRSSPPPASSPWRRLSGPSGHPLGAHTGPVGTTQGFPARCPCCGFNLGPSVDQQGPWVGFSPEPGHGPQGTLWTEWRVLWRCSARGPCGMGRGQRGVGEDRGCPDLHPRTQRFPRALGGSPWALRAALWPWLPPPAQPAAALALCAVPPWKQGPHRILLG